MSVTVLGEQDLLAVFVTSGLFTTNINFGLAPFAGQARWLAISACTNGAGTPALLSPRQELKPTPYALYATNAGVAAMATTATTASGAPWSGLTGCRRALPMASTTTRLIRLARV